MAEGDAGCRGKVHLGGSEGGLRVLRLGKGILVTAPQAGQELIPQALTPANADTHRSPAAQSPAP